MVGKVPLVYPDACIFIEVLQQRSDTWRDSFKILRAAERGDVRFVASSLLAAEVGRFRGDKPRDRVDELVVQYLDSVGTQWVEVDLFISREARNLSWRYAMRSGADAVHLATAVRQKADYFMSRDNVFPYGPRFIKRLSPSLKSFGPRACSMTTNKYFFRSLGVL